MKNFNVAIFDPRLVPAATQANDAVFASGRVYGIEVTVPALAARCIFNLDPQHGEGQNQAAIEAAITAELPPDGATLATVRADLDAVGAMAVLILRLEDPEPLDEEGVNDRIRLVAESDKFARGGWPGHRPLPTQKNPWPEQGTLAAIAAAVMDFKVPLGSRVRTMITWLLTGEEPKQYRAQVERERGEMIAALETGAIKFATTAQGRVAVVESAHRAATSVGYSLAPVVVALNPAFRQGPSEPYRKFTVCQFESGYVNLRAALADLVALEPGWGGSPSIGGSPQGVSSALTIDQVVEVVVKHLLR